MRFYVTFGGSGREAGYGPGGPDASRGALANQFVPVLKRIGEVEFASPARGIARAARSRTASAHLCFALPHELPEEAGEETWPVFGLALAACPTRPFAGRAGTDWCTRLARCGGAVCFSSHAASAVRALMGEGYTVLVAPPPVASPPHPAPPVPTVLQVRGAVLDTLCWPQTGPLDFAPAEAEDEGAPWPDPAALQPTPWRKTPRYRMGITRLHLVHVYREAFRDLLPRPLARAVSISGQAGTRAARRLLAMRQRPASPAGLPGRQEAEAQPEDSFEAWQIGQIAVSLSGLVFAAVHGAWDRAWGDALSAFVETCRADTTATLVIRTHGLDDAARAGFAAYLRRLGPFDCRVVLIAGAIDGGLVPLIAATQFYLCASNGEAAPLSALRFMAAGRPAVSPAHSALADVVTQQTGFVVDASVEYESFPGDVEERLDASGWRLDWASLCRGIAAARAMANRPDDYAERSGAVLQAMRACGPDAVLATLMDGFAGQARAGKGLAA